LGSLRCLRAVAEVLPATIRGNPGQKEGNGSELKVAFGRLLKGLDPVSSDGCPEAFEENASAGPTLEWGKEGGKGQTPSPFEILGLARDSGPREADRGTAGIRQGAAAIPEASRILGHTAQVAGNRALGGGNRRFPRSGPGRDSSDGSGMPGEKAGERILASTTPGFKLHPVASQKAGQGGSFLSDPPAGKSAHRSGGNWPFHRSERVTGLQPAESSMPAATGSGGSRPSAVTMADGFMQQVLENLNVRGWKVGRREVKIQLHPEELGHLRMEIGVREQQVVVKIHVENPFVKDLIENNLGQLRDGLLDQGLKMDGCSVTVSEHFQPQSGGAGDNPAGSGDQPLAAEMAEPEEGPSRRSLGSYGWNPEGVNLFV